MDQLFDSFDADGSGEIGFKELNKLLRRDVKAEEEAKIRRRKEIQESQPDVFIADVTILRKQCKTEINMLDPFAQMLKDENSMYHSRVSAEAAKRAARGAVSFQDGVK